MRIARSAVLDKSQYTGGAEASLESSDGLDVYEENERQVGAWLGSYYAE